MTPPDWDPWGMSRKPWATPNVAWLRGQNVPRCPCANSTRVSVFKRVNARALYVLLAHMHTYTCVQAHARIPEYRECTCVNVSTCVHVSILCGRQHVHARACVNVCACERTCEHTRGHSHWHSLALSVVAGFHGCWLKPGQQRSQEFPHVLCWQAHCSLWGARGHGKHSDPPWTHRDTRKAGLCRAFTEGGSWGRVLSGQRRWPLSAGQPGALGPSGFSYALSTTARTQGQVYGFPGPALRPRSRSAGGPGLSQTPPCIQGTCPGASGQERLPLPARGGHQSESWNPACCPGEQLPVAQWAGGRLAAAEGRGCSHLLHRTPSPAHTSTAQPGASRNHCPVPGPCAPRSRVSTTAAVLCRS